MQLLMFALAVPVLFDPAGQGEHDVPCEDGWYVPTGHASQYGSPVVAFRTGAKPTEQAGLMHVTEMAELF